MDELEQNCVIFQHDNATIHKAVIVSNWLAQQHFQVLQWPLQSSHLNPIEKVWDRLKARIYNIPISSKAMIKENIQQICASLPQEFFDKIVQSTLNRMAEVIKNRCAATHY